mmetsp:Transcript_17255/g.37679  ORF Transcript_17255/g.37679 Transcript_17255/m.37679 type:complete len:211 (-) Transcript_17255:814-1446(-)
MTARRKAPPPEGKSGVPAHPRLEVLLPVPVPVLLLQLQLLLPRIPQRSSHRHVMMTRRIRTMPRTAAVAMMTGRCPPLRRGSGSGTISVARRRRVRLTAAAASRNGMRSMAVMMFKSQAVRSRRRRDRKSDRQYGMKIRLLLLLGLMLPPPTPLGNARAVSLIWQKLWLNHSSSQSEKMAPPGPHLPLESLLVVDLDRTQQQRSNASMLS